MIELKYIIEMIDHETNISIEHEDYLWGNNTLYRGSAQNCPVDIYGDFVLIDTCPISVSNGVLTIFTVGNLPKEKKIELLEEKCCNKYSEYIKDILGEGKTTEWCSYCGSEVDIPNYINSRCPVCNETIFPCSCCDEDNCYNCKYE